jgi:threonine aldolase
MKYIDLRSDTVTMPTEEMRRAMAETEVGDDVFWDDPTVARLEEMAAARVKKEAALFMPTGSMANLVAILTHTVAGDEVVAGAYSHIVRHELGASARFAGVGFALADNPNTFVYPEDVERLILPPDFFNPKTSLVCLENALFNGEVVSLDIMQGCYHAAKKHDIPVHLDGARIFNAAAYLGVDVTELTACTDSLMFCLSKGMCAPAGSMLCGSKSFIEKARKFRKMVGGGMRQVGVIAACGIIALEKMSNRLKEDHDNARYLAQELQKIPHIFTEIDKVQINMVYWKTNIKEFKSDDFVKYMFGRGIKILPINEGAYRFVTNNDVSKTDIDTAVRELKNFIAAL